MHSGAVFSLTVVKYDKRRKDRCGGLLQYDEAQLMWGDEKPKNIVTSERQPTELEKSLMSPVIDMRRKPNHGAHYTRNIRILSSGLATEAIVKIHPPLIIMFNGQTTTP